MSDQQGKSPGRESMGRRRFIGLTLAASAVATVGGVLTPIVASLWPPARASTASNLRVQVGAVDELPPNSGKVVSVNNKTVSVVNSEKGGSRPFPQCAPTWAASSTGMMSAT